MFFGPPQLLDIYGFGPFTFGRLVLVTKFFFHPMFWSSKWIVYQTLLIHKPPPHPTIEFLYHHNASISKSRFLTLNMVLFS